MISRSSFHAPICAVVLLAAAGLAPLPLLYAQQGAPPADEAQVRPDDFAFEIGHATRSGSVYTISATQPLSSRLTGQKVRLKIVETALAGTTTRYFTFATGKHKTVSQLDASLAEIFRRFLANPPPEPNQELGKIGDVQHGGEVRFVATSSNILRFDNVTPDEPVRVSSYSRADVAALLESLIGASA